MKKTPIISIALATVLFACTKTETTPSVEQLNNTQQSTDNITALGTPISVNFPGLHPCGVAVSKSGKVAVSTYEGDDAPGKVLIWNSFQDFINNVPGTASYFIKDPESVAFDNNEALFISSTTGDLIYYTKNPIIAPAAANYIEPPSSIGNPRGIAFDTKNNLVAIYEGVQNGLSAIYMFKNPLASPGTQPAHVLLSNTSDSKHPLYFKNGQLMGVSLRKASLTSMKMYITQLSKNSGNGALYEYTYLPNGPSIATTSGRQLPLTGWGMDVATGNDDILYYTTFNFGGQGGRLYSTSTSLPTTTFLTQVCSSTSPLNTAWGVASYQNYILVADAFDNKVKVYKK